MGISHVFFIARRLVFGLRRDRHLSVSVMAPTLGLSLGVAVLIVVLSVINGFQQALQTQVLRLVPHVTLYTDGSSASDEAIKQQLNEHIEVSGYARFIEGMVLASLPGMVRVAKLNNLTFEEGSQLDFFKSKLDPGSRMPSMPFEILLGSDLAQDLGVRTDDKLMLSTPTMRVTPFGLSPRSKRFHIAGTFTTATEIDASTVFAATSDIDLLFAGQSVEQGWKLRLHDLFQAEQVAHDFLLSASRDLEGAMHWILSHGPLYEAIRVQKVIMWLLLTIVIAVAAFNVVASLSGLVIRKQTDIAVLMTLGARRRQIVAIFKWLALLVSAFGIGLGLLLGIGVALVLDDLYLWFEQASGIQLLSQYFVHYLPVQLLASDILLVVSVTLVLSLLASVLPAKRATRVRPVTVLRNE